YNIGIVNKSAGELGNVTVRYGTSVVAMAGGVVAGGYKTEGWIRIQIPEEAEVEWDDKGARRAAKCKLREAIPSKFDGGTLYFLIRATGNVEVNAIEAGDN